MPTSNRIAWKFVADELLVYIKTDTLEHAVKVIRERLSDIDSGKDSANDQFEVSGLSQTLKFAMTELARRYVTEG